MDQETRRARREQRRREIRRRRRLTAALAGLAVAAAVVVLVVVHTGAGPREHTSGDVAIPVHSRDKASSPGPTSSAKATSTVTGPRGTEPVPILMYHVIAEPPPGAPFPGLYVPTDEFAEQMRALKQAGWHGVTLDQIQANWTRGVPLGKGKPIVISFDNGYQSQYTQALPVLRRLGWVGVENIQLSGLPPSQGGFGAGQIKGLLAAGWELDTQGFTHADLITLDPAQLHYQVAVARRTIQHRFHVPVNWFCYPSGHYDESVLAAVKAAGYEGSTTVVPGWVHPREDPYRMHRLRVLGGTSAAGLLNLIEGTRGASPAPSSYNGT
jgi:peptidoglycan/xylan/chitin deacetylase (PgdA/CDA1 family)